MRWSSADEWLWTESCVDCKKPTSNGGGLPVWGATEPFKVQASSYVRCAPNKHLPSAPRRDQRAGGPWFILCSLRSLAALVKLSYCLINLKIYPPKQVLFHCTYASGKLDAERLLASTRRH